MSVSAGRWLAAVVAASAVVVAASAVVAAALLLPSPARAAAGSPDSPELHAGATELGLGGSLVSSGSAGTVSQVVLQAGRFVTAGPGLASLGAELGYRHVGNIGDLDILRATLHLTWTPAGGTSATRPFVALLGGVQHERAGSFGQTRFPLGAGLGVRSLLGARAAVRTEYRYARIIDPDVPSFNEHALVAGLVVFLGNHP